MAADPPRHRRTCCWRDRQRAVRRRSRRSRGAPRRITSHGLDEVRAASRRSRPSACRAATGIDAATIRRLAHELAAAPTAAVYGRIGTTTTGVRHDGVVADRRHQHPHRQPRPAGRGDVHHARWPAARDPGQAGPRPRVLRSAAARRGCRGHPEVMGRVPGGRRSPTRSRRRATGQIRALVTVAGNPVLSTPNSDRLAAALATLEFMVSVDIYLNETTRHADVILPPPVAAPAQPLRPAAAPVRGAQRRQLHPGRAAARRRPARRMGDPRQLALIAQGPGRRRRPGDRRRPDDRRRWSAAAVADGVARRRRDADELARRTRRRRAPRAGACSTS